MLFFGNNSLISPREHGTPLPLPKLQMEASPGSSVERMTWDSTSQHTPQSILLTTATVWRIESGSTQISVRPELWSVGKEMLSFLLNWILEDVT